MTDAKWSVDEGEISREFDRFKVSYSKSYRSGTQEHEMRKRIFERNWKEVERHNSREKKSWRKGINHLSDMTEKEYSSLLGYDRTTGFKDRHHMKGAVQDVDISNLPSNVDWRLKKVVTDVKNQGTCGSCWAITAAEAIESHYAIESGFLQGLSVQQILDCTPNPNECGGSGGCQGGTIKLAFETLINNSECTHPFPLSLYKC